MRYRETGEVHKDFHRSLNGTIGWLRKEYGEEFLDQTFRHMALDVYAAIHDDLQRGDTSQLIEHWHYFFARDGGDFRIQRDGDTTTLTVHRCPAVAYLMENGIQVDPAFCRQTIVVNQALATDTPFHITTQVLGAGRCVQSITPRARGSQHDSQ